MDKIQGYLIVLTDPDYKDQINNKYKGIDRIPVYPSPFEQEREAMDLYVFGDYKNQQYVIPSLDDAIKLWRGFSESPRTFEILFCRNHSFGQPFGATHIYIGYDVAGIGDFWSIIGDFPKHPQMQRYVTYLNKFGLFEEPSRANDFLYDYKRLKLADHDINFYVFELFTVVV